LCGLARFDLANRRVGHTFYARLLVFGDTLAQPHFAVVNCFDGVMSVFYFPVSTRSLIFLPIEEYAYYVNKLRQNVGLET